jgi:hypothetical protein
LLATETLVGVFYNLSHETQQMNALSVENIPVGSYKPVKCLSTDPKISTFVAKFSAGFLTNLCRIFTVLLQILGIFPH